MHLCEICKKILTRGKIKFPTFRHYDFSTVSKDNSFDVCNSCKIYFNFKKYKFEKKIFSSKNYAKTQMFLSRKILDTKTNSRFISRTPVQIEILKNKIKQSSSVLEVGCNTGELLFNIKKKFKNIIIFGVDTKAFKSFYKKTKINFINMEEVNKIKNQKIDILIFSQSIYYISPSIISFYLKMVKKDGLVYVEIPNFNENPHSILMGDVYFVPFVESIQKILALNKFKMNFVNKSQLNRELIIIGKRGIDKKKIKKINKIKEKFLIFGNTCKAAFLDEVSNNCLGFIVNNPNLKKLRNKKNLKMKKKIKDLIIFPNKRILNNQKKLKLINYKSNYKII